MDNSAGKQENIFAVNSFIIGLFFFSDRKTIRINKITRLVTGKKSATSKSTY